MTGTKVRHRTRARFYFQLTRVHCALELFGRCALQIYLLTYLLGQRRPPPRRVRSGYRWIPKFNLNFFVQRYVSDKISTKIRSVFLDERNRGKIPYLPMLKNPSNIPGSGFRYRLLLERNQFFPRGSTGRQNTSFEQLTTKYGRHLLTREL